jgi:hypothetical protein
MWTVTAMIPVFALMILVLAYYAFAKLTYTAYVCGSFAQLDSEIGWVLKPSVSSCLGGRSAFSSDPPWFESTVYTDKNGFRTGRQGGDTPEQAIFVTGDSFAFGNGVDFEDSFPGVLERLTGIPVVSAGSPAYSTPQGLLIAERWQSRIHPRVIIHLERGNWARGACSGSSPPTMILKPCYWQAPGQRGAQLVVPPAGQVERWAAWNVLPGGIVGAGEITWAYFLISRPITRVIQAITRLGLLSGMGHDFAAVGVDETAMRVATARHIGRLAEAANVPLILIDSNSELPRELIDELPAAQKALIHRIDGDHWDREVALPSETLPLNERKLPNDDHYAPGVNRLIAEMLKKELNVLGVVK